LLYWYKSANTDAAAVEAARRASLAEAGKVRADFKGVAATEAAHESGVHVRMLALVSALQESKDATDLAVATLRTGVETVGKRLKETERMQKQVSLLLLYCNTRTNTDAEGVGDQAQLDDTARIRSQIHDGLEQVSVNMTTAIGEVKKLAEANLQRQGDVLDAARVKIGEVGLAREGALKAEIVALEKEQVSVVVLHFCTSKASKHLRSY
jgi:hypothetical protein